MRAKFRCAIVDGPKEIDQWLNDVHESGKRNVFNVTLYAVSGGGPENDSFFASTPVGLVTLKTVNPNTAEFFKEGKEYYIDFTATDNG